jgi:hypothetical protein
MNSIVIAFVIGFCVGGFTCALLIASERRRVRIKTIKSHAIQDRLNIEHSRTCRDVLKAIECGNYESAKGRLSTSVAIGYYAVLTPSACISEAKEESRSIEIQAKSSPALAAALVSNKRDNSIEAILGEKPMMKATQ